MDVNGIDLKATNILSSDISLKCTDDNLISNSPKSSEYIEEPLINKDSTIGRNHHGVL